MNKQAGGKPIVLSASISLAAGVTGSPNLDTLQSPFDSAVLIDEIDFNVSPGTAAANIQGQNLGAAIWCKFQMGRIALSEDFVPIWNYCPTFDSLAEGVVQTLDAPTSYDFHFRWVLPAPLYVPSSNVLQPTFRNVPISGAATPLSTISVNISYKGRTTHEPPPPLVDVPFVGRWVVNEKVTSLIANELDLRNPFDVPIRVQRFLGRATPRDPVGTAYFWPQFSAGLPLNVRVWDSEGYNIANKVDHRSIFDPLRGGAWTFNSTLGPKQKYTIQLIDVSNLVPGYLVSYSFVGARKERMGAV